MSSRPVVLVVDDRPENLLTIEAVLQPLDITIQKALRAEAALHFLLQNDVAVVLLDVEMPDMDGFETARLIRQRPKSRDLPIIFITAVERGGAAVKEGYELGAVDYIVKPFQADILRSKVSVFVELFKNRQKDLLLIEEQTRRKEMESAIRRAKLLSDLSGILVSSMDREAVLYRLAWRMLSDETDFAVIFNKDLENRLRIIAFAGPDPPDPVFCKGTIFSYGAEDPLFRAAQGGRSSVLVDDFAAIQNYGLTKPHREFLSRRNLRTGVFIPLRAGDDTIGVIAVYRRNPQQFGSPDQLFIDELAERIALSMTNIELYDELRRANRAKDEFLAIVSHELRTPLVTILGWADLLMSKEIEPDRLQKALRTIQRNAKHQNDLIRDILDFSRIATGKFSMNVEKVDIRSLLEQSVESIRPIAEGKRIRLVQQTTETSVVVEGDPNRLQQLFSNLLSNAVKFTPEGGEVTMALDQTVDYAEIQITDTGIGIEPEFLPHIFEPFVQADTGTTRRYPGLGLGLAIVRRLVELHGGKIEVKSEGRGRGSTFVLTIPISVVKSRAS